MVPPAERPGRTVADIFREIDEDLRRDNLTRLWQRYGTTVVAAAVVVVLATAATVGWQRYERSQRLQRSQDYAAAVESIARSDAAAAAALARLADGGDGYAALARLQQARLRAAAGDAEGALAQYEALAKDDDAPRPLRDLAVILLAQHSLDTADPAVLMARLAPLAAADSPWRHAALELTGLLAWRAGDAGRARDVFAALADDLEAPPGLRARAAELLAALAGS